MRGAGAGAVRAAARPGRARRAAASAAGGAQRGPAAQQGEGGPRTSRARRGLPGARQGGEGEDSVIPLGLRESRSISCPGRVEGRWWVRVCGWARSGSMDPLGPRSPRSGEELEVGGSSEQEGSSVYKHFSTRPRPLAERLPALILLLHESFPAQVLLPYSHGVLGRAH